MARAGSRVEPIAAKDQSYVLYMLGQPALERTLLPVGDRTKADVRAVAASLGLRTAVKPDSQDVCFITSGDGRGAFLTQHMATHRGRVVDTAGTALGSVDAVELVTVGQRKGLGLAGGAAPRYVVDVDAGAGVVTVGSHAELLRDRVSLTDHRVGTRARDRTRPRAVQRARHRSTLRPSTAPSSASTSPSHASRPARASCSTTATRSSAAASPPRSFWRWLPPPWGL